jgi:hypothetical protein
MVNAIHPSPSIERRMTARRATRPRVVPFICNVWDRSKHIAMTRDKHTATEPHRAAHVERKRRTQRHGGRTERVGRHEDSASTREHTHSRTGTHSQARRAAARVACTHVGPVCAVAAPARHGTGVGTGAAGTRMGRPGRTRSTTCRLTGRAGVRPAHDRSRFQIRDLLAARQFRPLLGTSQLNKS